MSNETHSVLVGIGEAMLVLPAQSLVAVVNVQTLQRTGTNAQGLLGSVRTDLGPAPVLAGEVIIGRQPQPPNSRCRIALLRAPGARETLGVLARSYPLVVSLNGSAISEAEPLDSLPSEGILAYGAVGRRFVCLPDIAYWIQHAQQDLAAATLHGEQDSATAQHAD